MLKRLLVPLIPALQIFSCYVMYTVEMIRVDMICVLYKFDILLELVEIAPNTIYS